MPPALERDEETLVAHALAAESRPEPHVLQQIDCRLFENARAYAIEHVTLTADLDRDRVDARALQQVSQQQSRRSGANDADRHTRRHGRVILTRARAHHYADG